MIDAFITCLALNIYYEARNQPISGQVAVAHVVLTRVADSRMILAKSLKRGRCVMDCR